VTFRHRILLDRLVAAPVALAVNLLARVLGPLLRRDHAVAPARTREIVVTKLVGMGSAIQATPLLRALRARFPDARITFLTLCGNRALVERFEDVDEVLCLDDRSVLRMLTSTIAVVLRLALRRVDHFLDLEVYAAFTCLLGVFTLARNRFSFYRHTARFKHGIYTHMVFFNTRMPVRRLYLQLGGLLGADASQDGLTRIRVHAADVRSLAVKLEALGLSADEHYCVVNPNASDLLLERRWPKEFVVHAVRRLVAESGCQVVLTGAASEVDHVNDIVAGFPESQRLAVVNTAGRLSLGELLALIDRAAVVVTNDTGPMHMSLALRRPTVCLFGPAHPEHYAPDGDRVVSMYAAVPCSPCVHEVDVPPCHGDNVCMKRLKPDAVVNAALALLETASSPRMPATVSERAIRLPVMWTDTHGRPVGATARTAWHPRA